MKGMSFICTQTLVWPAGGTAGSSWGGALVVACSVLPSLLLSAKVRCSFLPTPSPQPSLPQLLYPAVLPSSSANGERGRVPSFTVVGPGEESSVAEVGGCPG